MIAPVFATENIQIDGNTTRRRVHKKKVVAWAVGVGSGVFHNLEMPIYANPHALDGAVNPPYGMIAAASSNDTHVSNIKRKDLEPSDDKFEINLKSDTDHHETHHGHTDHHEKHHGQDGGSHTPGPANPTNHTVAPPPPQVVGFRPVPPAMRCYDDSLFTSVTSNFFSFFGVATRGEANLCGTPVCGRKVELLRKEWLRTQRLQGHHVDVSDHIPFFFFIDPGVLYSTHLFILAICGILLAVVIIIAIRIQLCPRRLSKNAPANIEEAQPSVGWREWFDTLHANTLETFGLQAGDRVAGLAVPSMSQVWESVENTLPAGLVPARRQEGHHWNLDTPPPVPASPSPGAGAMCWMPSWLMLAALRDIPNQMASLRAGSWQAGVGKSAHGRQIGIYGYGRIGRQVADYADAFGMKVVIWGSERGLARAAADGAPAPLRPSASRRAASCARFRWLALRQIAAVRGAHWLAGELEAVARSRSPLPADVPLVLLRRRRPSREGEIGARAGRAVSPTSPSTVTPSPRDTRIHPKTLTERSVIGG